MSFASIERSRQKGKPVNLFYFRYGEASSAFYAYTDCETAIERNGVTYQPLPIDRGKIVTKGSLDKQALEVRMTLNVGLAEHFRVYPPTSVANLTIYQGHISDPDAQFLVVWTGRILSSKRTDNELILTCEPIRTTLKRVGLRRHYQYSCMHVLYGPMCRANKAAATKEVVVAQVQATALILQAGWTTPELKQKYVGGMVEWENAANDTELRTILRTAGDKIVLSGPTRNIIAGQTVRIVLGCNHNFRQNDDKTIHEDTDCFFVHDNIQNYGGCPWIPTENPVGRLNQYY